MNNESIKIIMLFSVNLTTLQRPIPKDSSQWEIKIDKEKERVEEVEGIAWMIK